MIRSLSLVSARLALASSSLLLLTLLWALSGSSLELERHRPFALLGVMVIAALTFVVSFVLSRVESESNSKRLEGPTNRTVVRRGARRRPSVADLRRLSRLRQLERQVDVLSAMRNLSLIANDEVDFAGVVVRALKVLEELLECHEIALHLITPDRTNLTLAALRRGGQTELRDLADEAAPEALLQARAVLARRRATLERDSQGGRATVLLVAESEVIGTLSLLVASPTGLPIDDRALLAELENLAKHVALVIRKPTLYQRAVFDGLTGLRNKRAFHDEARREMAAARRLGNPLSMLVIDIDHFKRVNDRHGHVVGDQVLARIAETLRESVRDYDRVYRFGGEEFVVVAPNCPVEAALLLGERIRAKASKVVFEADEELDFSVTLSVGVAGWVATMHAPLELVAVADRWLYRAKREGRDQVRPRGSELFVARDRGAGHAKGGRTASVRLVASRRLSRRGRRSPSARRTRRPGSDRDGMVSTPLEVTGPFVAGAGPDKAPETLPS